jgi:hypothetical protein
MEDTISLHSTGGLSNAIVTPQMRRQDSCGPALELLQPYLDFFRQQGFVLTSDDDASMSEHDKWNTHLLKLYERRQAVVGRVADLTTGK